MVPKQHEEIIMEALQDYRKWFEDEPCKIQEIDMAISSVNQNQGYFSITSVCKDKSRCVTCAFNKKMEK